MNTKYIKCALIFLSSFLLFSGCATFKSEIKGQFQSPAEKLYNADRVRLLFIFSHYRQTRGWDAIPKLDNKWQRISEFDDMFRNALEELNNIENYATYTDFASDVNEPERRAEKDSLIKNHDFIIKMRFDRDKSFAKHFFSTLVSTVSLTLFPVPYYNYYAVDVEIFNSKNQLINSYKRNSNLTRWVHLPMMFLYPFYPEKRQKEELYVEFMRDIFRQMETEKVLVKSN